MATSSADINEIPANVPATNSIEPESPLNDWPGLEDFSEDSDGIQAAQLPHETNDDEMQEELVIPDLNRAYPREHRKELTNNERLEALHMLLPKSTNGVLHRKATKEVALAFGVGIRTIQPLWKRARETDNKLHANDKVKNCGRKRIQFDLEAIRSIPLRERTTLRSLASSLGVSKTFLIRRLKEGVIKRHTNAVKPCLTLENATARVQHCLSSLDPSSLPNAPTFSRMENVVHIDEKWFYLTRKTQTYYLLHDEPDPVRNIKSSHFIPKVMFLAAVARPRYDSDGLCTFDGKIGVFPLVQSVPALRSSHNRPRGTVEIKPIANVTRDVIREFMINKVLPAIAVKWPRETIGEAIFVQQDNARTHIQTDDVDFLCAVQHSGMIVSMVCQPPNSPNLNVLDLGFFRAIQSLQSKQCAKSLGDLVVAVEQAFLNFEDYKCNNVFLTLQACMVEILKCDGSNTYRIPHMGKARLQRQRALPLSLTCPTEVYANARFYQPD